MINWSVFVVGKPGLDYSGINSQYSGRILTWSFAAMAREDIISTAGEVAKQISALNKWLEAAKEVLKQSMIAGGEIQVGDSLDIAGSNFWGATFSHRERTGIDLDRLKAEFGDAWIASRSKTTDYYEIRFKAVK